VVTAIRRVKISGLSTYVPPKLLTNDDLEKLVDTTNEWILQRTGIKQRHIVEPGVATSDLAKEAAIGAMQQAGVTPEQIGFIVVGTTTPDTIFPSTACVLQHKIGAVNAWGFDLGAACSGFTYALTTGMQMVATGAVEHALIVGADVMSSIIDYKDRTTCVIFGDGAGAAVVSVADDSEPAIIDFAHEIDGGGGRRFACLPAEAAFPPRMRPSTSACIPSSRMARRSSSSRCARPRRSPGGCWKKTGSKPQNSISSFHTRRIAASSPPRPNDWDCLNRR